MIKPVKQTKAILGGEYVIPFQPSLAKAFDVCGALLIQQVHYWTMEKDEVQEDGCRWVYNTHEQWAAQLEVYSVIAIRKKLKELQVLGILVVGNFNKRAYDRTHWYRIDYEKLADILSLRRGGMWSILSLPSDKKYRMQLIQSIAPIPENTTEKTKDLKPANEKTVHEKTKISLVEKAFKEKENQKDQEQNQEPNLEAKEENCAKEEKEKNMATTDEIMNAHKSKVLAPDNTRAGLHTLWKKRMSTIHGAFSKDLITSEKAMLNNFLKHGKMDSWVALDFALQNWGKFTWEVKTKKGFSTAPEIPMPGYVLQHYDILLQLSAKMVLQSIDKPKHLTLIGKPVILEFDNHQVIASSQLVSSTKQPEPESLVSPDDVLASLALFGKKEAATP